MTKSIIIFSLVSAALHAGLFMMVSPSEDNSIQAGSPFRVSIVAQRPQQKTSEPANESEQKLVTNPLIKKTLTPAPVIKTVEKKTVPVKEKLAETISEKQVTVEASDTDSSIAITEQTSSLLRAQLQEAFRLQFYYPRLAIRRGWQGEVRIGLEVSANGVLEKIRIIKSSGHGILDKAAMKSLAKVESLPDATSLLNGQGLQLELPVEYRLL